MKRGRQLLSYSGGGKVSVPVADIIGSPKVQQQVEGVRQIQIASMIRHLQRKIDTDAFTLDESNFVTTVGRKTNNGQRISLLTEEEVERVREMYAHQRGNSNEFQT